MSLDVGRLVAYLEVDDSKFDAGLSKGHDKLSRFGSFVGTAVKAVGAAAIGIGAAAGGIGIKTAAGMEQAEIGFTTMLGSGAKAKAFLAQLSNFAAATPFDLPGLQTAASSLISAGVDASKVIPIMTSLGNATSGMGTGAAGVQRATIALQQMNAAGKISGDDLNQLRDAGIPVYDLLAKATGKSKAAIVDLAAKGKLGKLELEQLMTALADGKGLERFNGLMEKQSVSLTGLWSTLKDTVGQGLATAIQPLVPLIKSGLAGAIALATAWAPKLAAGIAVLVDKGKAAGPVLRQAGQWIKDLFPQHRSGAVDFNAMLTTTEGVARRLWPQIKDGATQLKGIAPAASVGAAALRFVADHASTLIQYMPLLIAAFVAYKGAQAASNVVEIAHLPIAAANTLAMFASASANRALATQMATFNGVQTTTTLGTARQAIATGASTAAGLAARSATALWTGAQWLLNAALTANPIGIVIVVVAALVAAIVIAYQKSETFRTVVQAVGRAVVEVFKQIASFWLLVVSGILTGLSNLLGALGHLPGKMGAPFRAAKGAVDAARQAVDQLRASINATKGKTVGVRVTGASAASQAVADLRWQLDRVPRSVTVGVLNKVGAMPVGRNATGTASWRGGLTWVGERGPELLDLPQGSAIHSASKSAQIAAGGQGLEAAVVRALSGWAVRVERDGTTYLQRPGLRHRLDAQTYALGAP